MKKFLVLVLTVAVLASSFVMPSMAATESANMGGFDFYSITFHYSEPVVVGYVEKEREITTEDGKTKKEKYLAFGEAVESYTIYVTENKFNQNLSSLSESMILTYGANESNFFSVSSADLGIGDTELAYTKYPTPGAYITNIQDKTAIVLKNTTNICGLVELYDQANTVNPNVVTTEDGCYFVDAETGAKLDDNGYILDDNNLWHENSGARVEAFIEDIDGNLVWVPFDARVADGRVLANSEVTVAHLIEKGILAAYPEFDKTVDYNGDGAVNRKDQNAYNDKKAVYESNYIQLYRIKTDTNADGKYSEAEIAAVDGKDKTFTADDIEKFVSTTGVETLNRGTPASGVPKTKATIKGVSVEIDALGTQLYDVSADPQQKNTIVLSVGNVEENVAFANEVVAKNPKKINNIGTIVGTAKSVTTKTSMALEFGADATKKSVDFEVTAEGLAAIKNNVDLYLNFHVSTLQPVDGIDLSATRFDFNSENGAYYIKKPSKSADDPDAGKIIPKQEFDKLKGTAKKQYDAISISEFGAVSVYKITESSLANAPVSADSDVFVEFNLFGFKVELSKTLFFIIIGAAAAVVIAIVVIIILAVSKKKKKKVAEAVEEAPVAESAPEAESATDETVAEEESASEEVAEEAKED